MSASHFILFLLLVSFKNPIQHMLTQEFVLSKNATGVTGSALYRANLLSTCLSNGTFDTTLQFLDQPRRPNDISSDPDKVCLCNKDGAINCSNFTYSTSAVPSKEFSVSVCAVGNMNGSSEGTIAVHFTNTNVLSTLRPPYTRRLLSCDKSHKNCCKLRHVSCLQPLATLVPQHVS